MLNTTTNYTITSYSNQYGCTSTGLQPNIFGEQPIKFVPEGEKNILVNSTLTLTQAWRWFYLGYACDKTDSTICRLVNWIFGYRREELETVKKKIESESGAKRYDLSRPDPCDPEPDPMCVIDDLSSYTPEDSESKCIGSRRYQFYKIPFDFLDTFVFEVRFELQHVDGPPLEDKERKIIIDRINEINPEATMITYSETNVTSRKCPYYGGSLTDECSDYGVARYCNRNYMEDTGLLNDVVEYHYGHDQGELYGAIKLQDWEGYEEQSLRLKIEFASYILKPIGTGFRFDRIWNDRCEEAVKNLIESFDIAPWGLISCPDPGYIGFTKATTTSTTLPTTSAMITSSATMAITEPSESLEWDSTWISINTAVKVVPFVLIIPFYYFIRRGERQVHEIKAVPEIEEI